MTQNALNLATKLTVSFSALAVAACTQPMNGVSPDAPQTRAEYVPETIPHITYDPINMYDPTTLEPIALIMEGSCILVNGSIDLTDRDLTSGKVIFEETGIKMEGMVPYNDLATAHWMKVGDPCEGAFFTVESSTPPASATTTPAQFIPPPPPALQIP